MSTLEKFQKLTIAALRAELQQQKLVLKTQTSSWILAMDQLLGSIEFYIQERGGDSEQRAFDILEETVRFWRDREVQNYWHARLDSKDKPT